MTMGIIGLQTQIGEDVFYDEDFRNLIDSHLTYLRNLNTTQVISFEPFLSYKYEGDLNGLLTELKIARKYFYPIMKMNGYNHTGDLKGTITTLIIPDLAEIESLASVYMSKNSNY